MRKEALAITVSTLVMGTFGMFLRRRLVSD